MAPTRKATHAGSWYTKSGAKLDEELTGWVSAVKSTPELPLEFPVKGCKAIIAPHAGYSYSGATAAWAYKSVDVSAIERVFILGPSHHAYMDGCALSTCTEYATPLGSLVLDREAIKELAATGKFLEMDLQTDEDEHSVEMHLPYVRKIFADKQIKIVPILVGSISSSKELFFGSILAPYLASPSTLFIISSDFCHWGTRFSYTYFQPPIPSPSSAPPPAGYKLSRSTPISSLPCSIHASIATLDKLGMDAIQFSSSSSSSSPEKKTAGEAHGEFTRYLGETKNTICGRHPIGVLLGAVASLEENGEEGWRGARLEWVRYERSGLVDGYEESSVSYASAFVVIG